MLNARNTNIFFLVLLAALVWTEFRVDVSPWFYVLMISLYVAIHFYGATQVAAQFFVAIKCRGPKNSKAVALTFDDGPLPLMTEKILDILKNYSVPATFFCIGKRVEAQPGIAKKIHEQGHLIGNHTFLHGKFFDLLSAAQITAELQQADNAIEKAIGQKPRYFRPPYGVTNPSVARAIKKGAYITMGWSVRSFDTVSKDEDKLFERVTKKIAGGDVILFHDYCHITLRVLPRVLEHIQKVGLKVVRLDELMNEKAYV